MPYKSSAQQRFFHAAGARGEISKKTVHEFDEATKHMKGGFGSLPAHKKNAGRKSEHAAHRPRKRATP